MKIKYQIILLLTAMVMLLGGCGKKNTVVTGRYYYPDQEKDAKTEETSDDADESAETTEKNEAVIGSDQFLIKTNDMQEECLTLEQIASGKEYVYYYTLATRFLDKYGNRTAVSYFEPGRVITVGEKDDQGKVTQVQISDAVWEYPDVSHYSVDMDRGIFKIGDERYSYDADLYICEDDLRKQLSDLTDLDTLRVTGIGKKLISIVVTTGHGELALTNTDLFEGSFIQIGSKICRQEVASGARPLLRQACRRASVLNVRRSLPATLETACASPARRAMKRAGRAVLFPQGKHRRESEGPVRKRPPRL